PSARAILSNYHFVTKLSTDSMITPHPSFVAPTNAKIGVWRYMNLASFVWTLQNKALYFCRCDLLGDPYEGHLPKPNLDMEDDFVKTFAITGVKFDLHKMFKTLIELPE